MKTGGRVKQQKSPCTPVWMLKKLTKQIKSLRYARMLLQPQSGKTKRKDKGSQGSASQQAAYLSDACWAEMCISMTPQASSYRRLKWNLAKMSSMKISGVCHPALFF